MKEELIYKHPLQLASSLVIFAESFEYKLKHFKFKLNKCTTSQLKLKAIKKVL